MKTVGKIIGEINNKDLKKIIERLISCNFPEVVIKQSKKEYKNNSLGEVIVKGLDREHKIKDELVKKVIPVHTKRKFQNRTDNVTIYILELLNGKTYYYDYYDNRIEDDYNKLDVDFLNNLEQNK